MDGCREYREGRLIGKNVKKKKEKEKGKKTSGPYRRLDYNGSPYTNVGFEVWQVGARHSISGKQGPYTTPEEKATSVSILMVSWTIQCSSFPKLQCTWRGDSNALALGKEREKEESGGKLSWLKHSLTLDDVTSPITTRSPP